MATTRSCKCYLWNKWGETITNVALTHTHGDVVDTIRADTLQDKEKTPTINMNFETGSAPDKDFWSVSFTDESGDIWHTPYNDRCNLSLSEDGTTIHCNVDGGRKQLHVVIDDGCYFDIKKK